MPEGHDDLAWPQPLAFLGGRAGYFDDEVGAAEDLLGGVDDLRPGAHVGIILEACS